MFVTAKRQNVQAFAANKRRTYREQIEKERARLDQMVEEGLDFGAIMEQSRKLDALIDNYYHLDQE